MGYTVTTTVGADGLPALLKALSEASYETLTVTRIEEAPAAKAKAARPPIEAQLNYRSVCVALAIMQGRPDATWESLEIGEGMSQAGLSAFSASSVLSILTRGGLVEKTPARTYRLTEAGRQRLAA